ncbi:hypothetical protein HF325_004507 [Metschnikowia pulcherrima]|uniref:Eukaryotic translation initiation factor 4E n=1 Tax=Metschnikowia pulcherrima TaxID=27326 RepID=A0A8H7LAD7_9ASCO|nr:hypothetical protein HF325_004507 [Metschnikowia pulcherrima]
MSEDLTKKTEELTLENQNATTVLLNKEDFTAKHPLNSKWTLWYTKPQVNKSETWSDLLKPVITFDTVEEFWGIYNSIPVANQLPIKSDYHLFKEGIKPEWEDEKNAKGGRWQYSFVNKRDVKPRDQRLTIEDDENEVNGIVLNIRRGYRVAIWTKDCDSAKLKTIGERFKKVLKLADDQKLEFMSHDTFNAKGEPQLTV